MSNIVQIDVSEIEQLNVFVSKMTEEKIKESHYKIDKYNLKKRMYNGFLGELAVEKFLNKKFIDFSIGKSKKYHVADLKSIGYDIGIKTVEEGKFPLISKFPKRPEIINVVILNNTVKILGVATVEVLKKYSDDKYILSPSLRKRGTKTGFYGLDYLIPLKDYLDGKNN